MVTLIWRIWLCIDFYSQIYFFVSCNSLFGRVSLESIYLYQATYFLEQQKIISDSLSFQPSKWIRLKLRIWNQGVKHPILLGMGRVHLGHLKNSESGVCNHILLFLYMLTSISFNFASCRQCMRSWFDQSVASPPSERMPLLALPE